jgi:hypothetical protein
MATYSATLNAFLGQWCKILGVTPAAFHLKLAGIQREYLPPPPKVVDVLAQKSVSKSAIVSQSYVEAFSLYCKMWEAINAVCPLACHDKLAIIQSKYIPIPPKDVDVLAQQSPSKSVTELTSEPNKPKSRKAKAKAKAKAKKEAALAAAAVGGSAANRSLVEDEDEDEDEAEAEDNEQDYTDWGSFPFLSDTTQSSSSVAAKADGSWAKAAAILPSEETVARTAAILAEEQQFREVKPPKKGPRCKYGMKCNRRDCTNSHPQGFDITMNIPNCSNGDKCFVKYCWKLHPDNHNPASLCKRCNHDENCHRHNAHNAAMRIGEESGEPTFEVPLDCHFIHSDEVEKYGLEEFSY